MLNYAYLWKKWLFWLIYVDKGSNRMVFLHEMRNFRVKFPKIMTISTDLAI